jgi:hypothetical protein
MLNVNFQGGIIKYNCTCCNDVNGEFSVDEWNKNPNDVVKYRLLDFCPNCGYVIVNYVLKFFYTQIRGIFTGLFAEKFKLCPLGMRFYVESFIWFYSR